MSLTPGHCQSCEGQPYLTSQLHQKSGRGDCPSNVRVSPFSSFVLFPRVYRFIISIRVQFTGVKSKRKNSGVIKNNTEKKKNFQKFIEVCCFKQTSRSIYTVIISVCIL